MAAARNFVPRRFNPVPCRSCRRLRSFDFDFQDQKIAACGSSYKSTSVIHDLNTKHPQIPSYYCAQLPLL
ncbi:hypothetical protein EMIT0P218_330024 [Pseudomonas sp. IT-P218]